eukprot:Pgem_evm1s5150
MRVISSIICMASVISILFQSSFITLGMNLPQPVPTKEKRNIFDDIAKGVSDTVEDVADDIVDIPNDIVDDVEDIGDTIDNLDDATVPCKPKVINSSGQRMKFLFYDADDNILSYDSKKFYLDDGETGTGKCSKGFYDHKYCEFLFKYTQDDGFVFTCDTGKSLMVYTSFQLSCDETYNFTHHCDFNKV